VGLIKSSLNGLAIGWVPNPGQELFAVNLRNGQTEQWVPLTRNLRPVPRNLGASVPAGTTVVEFNEVITSSTDPNNNIDFTKGFEMLSFPNDEGTWSFLSGTLTIRPRATQTDPIQATYRLCDNEGLCSDTAIIYVEFIVTPAPPALSPGSTTIVVVTTPVPVPVPTPVRIYVFPPDNGNDGITTVYDEDDFDSESSATNLSVTLLTTFVLLFLSLIM